MDAHGASSARGSGRQVSASAGNSGDSGGRSAKNLRPARAGRRTFAKFGLLHGFAAFRTFSMLSETIMVLAKTGGTGQAPVRGQMQG